jgi:hypothetical protein
MPGNPSRQLWIVAIAVSVVCLAGLAYALATDWNTQPERTLARPAASTSSGFGLGLLIGIGAGVVIGSLIVIRKR